MDIMKSKRIWTVRILSHLKVTPTWQYLLQWLFEPSQGPPRIPTYYGIENHLNWWCSKNGIFTITLECMNLYSRIWLILIMISKPFGIKISSTTSIFTIPISIFSTPITTMVMAMRPISSLMAQEMNIIQSISPKVWIIIHSRILRVVHMIWNISKRFYLKNQCRKSAIQRLWNWMMNF